MKPEPTFDADGYPTEETLAAIREWPITTPSDSEGLLLFVQKAWNYSEYFIRVPRRVRRFGVLRRRWILHTVGWSGNESLIEALEQHLFFWLLCWHKSERGGHYEFETYEERE